MELKRLEGLFTVCKAASAAEINLDDDFCFVGKTDEELSVVCREEHAPRNSTAREDGWRGFRIEGTLDFSLTGILSRLSGILAAEKIGIFALSTFNTDYIFVKAEHFDRAMDALARAGYTAT